MRPHNQIPNSVTLSNLTDRPISLDGLVGLEANEANKVIDVSKFAENGYEGWSWKSKLWMSITGAVNAGTVSLDASTPSVTIGAIDDLGYGEELNDDNTIRPGLPAYLPGPSINGVAVPAGSAYIDLFFNKGVFQADGDPLAAGDLLLSFEQGEGTATDAVISSIKQNDDADEGVAADLAGGETVIRVFLTITGAVGGGEKVTVTVAGNVMADADGKLGTTQTRTATLLAA